MNGQPLGAGNTRDYSVRGAAAMVQDMRLIELKGISKSFDGTEALSDVNLYIRKCEFITLLGPSGCGENDDVAHHRRL